ncbi:thymidylate synthase [Candidatus Peregrinibacteria bacterium]|jgi:thymidylate synthase|nr:thymidylate synthase [Candidatus Peregrinibacteria bacterium]
MQQYLSLVEEVLENGEEKFDRTGTGTISVFGMQRKYDLRDGFPLVTTKKTLFKAVIRELLWFLKGSTNINDNLTQHTPIWNAWAAPDGELGPIYGYQWRSWPKYGCSHGKCDECAAKGDGDHIDQIAQAIDMIKNNPDSRRIIVSAWNVAQVPDMALPPCHLLFQFYVINGRLDCQLYQRSADIALGVPFNIASYAALMIMIAQECDLTPGVFTHTIGDAHIYLNHVEGMKEQLTKTPHKLPTLKIAKKPFDEIEFEDFVLEDYTHEAFIKFPIAV